MTAGRNPGRGLHATAVVYGESGVAILGASGAGKSALALALLALAKASGKYAALIGDDRIWVRAAGGRLVASGAPHMAGLIERRGAGILSAPSEAAAVIRLVVDLSEPNGRWPRRPEEPDEYLLEGVRIPRLALDSGTSAIDKAVSVDERLERTASGRGRRIAISLEQCAAVHKNRQLVWRKASVTSKAGSDD